MALMTDMARAHGAGLGLEKASASYKVAYERAYAGFIRHGGDKFFGSLSAENWKVYAYASSTDIFDLFLRGRDLVYMILEQSEVPTAKIKAFEKAHRTFTQKRLPKIWMKWFIANLKSAQLLLEAENWPRKGEGSGEDKRTFEVGRFTVINQTTNPPDASVKLLLAAEELMEASGIPLIKNILYGEVYIVGNIERKRDVGARYNQSKDTIQLLLVPRFAEYHLHGLIHEFGHRYWTAAKGELDIGSVASDPVMFRPWDWITHHTKLKIAHDDVVLPKIGDELEYVTGHPRVVKYGYRSRSSKPTLETQNGFVWLDSYMSIARKAAKQNRFPTPYSATDPEEHFCEAFAMYCLGSLPEPHKSNFEALVGVKPKAANPTRTKRMMNPRNY